MLTEKNGKIYIEQVTTSYSEITSEMIKNEISALEKTLQEKQELLEEVKKLEDDNRSS